MNTTFSPVLESAGITSPPSAGSEPKSPQDGAGKKGSSPCAGLNVPADGGISFPIKVVCAWCKADLGTKHSSEKPDRDTSHGMCDVCYAKQILPDLCREIERASYSDLIFILLADGAGFLDETATKGIRELCKRRHEALRYLENKPVDDLA